MVAVVSAGIGVGVSSDPAVGAGAAFGIAVVNGAADDDDTGTAIGSLVGPGKTVAAAGEGGGETEGEADDSAAVGNGLPCIVIVRLGVVTVAICCPEVLVIAAVTAACFVAAFLSWHIKPPFSQHFIHRVSGHTAPQFTLQLSQEGGEIMIVCC